MLIPDSAADKPEMATDSGEVATDKNFIENPYFSKKFLTPREAVDLINQISGILYAYEVSKGE